MRKSKFPPLGLQFRFLLILAGALFLLAAVAPSSKADLIAYFNFEDSFDGGPPDFTSDIVPENPGGGIVLTTITTDYASGEALSNGAADVVTAHRRQADVEQHEVGMKLLGRIECFRPVVRCTRVVSAKR